MATKPIATPLPADLPEAWQTGQTVAPTGAEVGLSQQHGYNYLMEQVNAAQEAVNTINNAFGGLATSEDVGDLTPGDIGAIPASEKGKASGVATLDGAGRLEQSEIPNIDCGVWDTTPVAEHNAAAEAHQNLLVDGNNTTAVKESATLNEHMANPMAHQNLVIDGNAGQ